MPSITDFKIENFKGAKSVHLDLSGKVETPVLTLIGLNESGKTTILEALSYFITGDNAVSSLFDGVHSKSTIDALIPVHRKAAFTGDIRIKATVLLDNKDISEIINIAKESKLRLDSDGITKSFTIYRNYNFEDSEFKKSTNVWEHKLSITTKTGVKLYARPVEADKDLWLKVVRYVERTLPRIAYFPTFLVDMPQRIYLKEHEGERPVNRYYRDVFEDVLKSVSDASNPLSLEKHVLNRISSYRESENSPVWATLFFGAPEKRQIDSVFQKISNAITREVIGSWRKVFQRQIAAKAISVEWGIDPQKDDLPYASFYVSDGESKYSISERSLGFRWFFSFLLFTVFKQKSERPTLFVFDEPAANLHAKAQAELLTSFSRITSSENRIIYSTHSHHMINPHWLSGAYIVENTAIDHEKDDAFDLDTKPTNIVATGYKKFVSQYPNRTSYFQPVIEQLEYVAPAVIGAPPYLIVEGISDFYALSIVKNDVAASKAFSLMPGSGCGASDPLISLLMGRGEKFVILLDDDKAGRKAAERYKERWYLSDRTIVTLASLDASFAGLALEGLLSKDTKAMISKKFAKSAVPTKKEIGLYLAEANAVQSAEPVLCASTAKNFMEILRASASLF